MINCDNFISFMVEDDAGLEPAVREARDLHARKCEECGAVLDGYQAYLDFRAREKAGTLTPEELDPFDPVRDVVLRAADEAILERERAEQRVRARSVRARVVAAVSAAALLLGGGGQLAWEASCAVAKAPAKHPEESWATAVVHKGGEAVLGSGVGPLPREVTPDQR